MGGKAPYTFQWMKDGSLYTGKVMTVGGKSMISPSDLTPASARSGNYSVKVKDSAGTIIESVTCKVTVTA